MYMAILPDKHDESVQITGGSALSYLFLYTMHAKMPVFVHPYKSPIHPSIKTLLSAFVELSHKLYILNIFNNNFKGVLEMNKITKMMISFVLVCSVLFPLSSSLNQASAASGKTVTECTGYGYTKTCKKYKVFKYNTYWTKSEVKKVVKKYEANSSNKQLIIDYIISLAPPAGIAVLFKNIGWNNTIGPFQKAKSKGTGLRIKYDMYVPLSGPNIVKTKNYKVSYE